MNNNQKHVTAASIKMHAIISLSESGCLQGSLECIFFETPVLFHSLLEMIEIMEITFDTKGFPERQMLPRTFGKPKKRLRKHELDLNKYLSKFSCSKENLDPGGKKAAFDIWVRYRYYAEWQGSIFCVEKEDTKFFSSIIELVKIIDSALKS